MTGTASPGHARILGVHRGTFWRIVGGAVPIVGLGIPLHPLLSGWPLPVPTFDGVYGPGAGEVHSVFCDRVGTSIVGLLGGDEQA